MQLDSSLAVRYRPQKITEIAGQDHIKIQLKGILNSKRIPHTLLLTGASGQGKTTIARIIARYINCDGYSACENCLSCQSGIQHPDIIEMNMSEQRGIDDVRALINSSRNMPRHRYKVYILDEIHQITTPAANAFLKFLEEPPSKTIWILATTNPEKLLPTILSRCMRFQLLPIDEQSIVKRLFYIAKQEGVNFKSMENGLDTLKLIASLTNGQMRDSIQLLESVLYAVHSGEEINSGTLLNKYVLTGEIDLDKSAVNLLIALLENNMEKTFYYIHKAENPRGLAGKLRWLVHYLMLDSIQSAKFAPYSGRLFYQKIDKRDLIVDIKKLAKVQYINTVLDREFNSSSLDEEILMISHFSKLIGHD